MNAPTSITRSVRDLALDVINAAETLAQFRTESRKAADAMRSRWAGNQTNYFQRKGANRG